MLEDEFPSNAALRKMAKGNHSSFSVENSWGGETSFKLRRDGGMSFEGCDEEGGEKNVWVERAVVDTTESITDDEESDGEESDREDDSDGE